MHAGSPARMNKKLKAALIIGALIVLLLFGREVQSTPGTPESTASSTPASSEEPSLPKISHRQEVWRNALEWCESRGNPDAINKIDRDGTSSYGAYQFKPETFWAYGEMYSVVRRPEVREPQVVLLVDGSLGSEYDALMHRDTQAAIVDQMILHYDEINWRQQFPDCIKNKIGMPPRS